MATYSSGSVKVFPSTSRVADTSGKFTSESNFVNIINSLIDVKDFKVTSTNKTYYNDGYLLTKEANGNKWKVSVIIHGYYFKLDEVQTQSGQALWLGIRLRDGDARLVSSDGSNVLDASGNFTGLSYEFHSGSSKPTASTETYFTDYWLSIHDGSDWVNEVKFDSEKINYLNNLGVNVTVKNELDTLNTDKQDNLSVPDSPTISGQNGFMSWDGAHTLSSNQTHLQKIVELEGTTAGVDGDNVHLVRVDGGHITNINNKNIGSSFNGTSAQNVYISNGKVTGGQTIYISTNVPGETQANLGDLWFRYSNN